MATEIPIEQIQPHPSNSNVMTDGQMKKLQRHLKRTGRYEPLVVRPIPSGDGGQPTYQVLNGHHRLRALGQLGHETVRCEVWEVDDREALLLLATLNRLEGRDDPMRRAALLARLAGPLADELGQLARLLPEDRAALDRALALARKPLPAPAPPQEAAAPLRPMTFFLQPGQQGTVERALRLARPGKEPTDESPAADDGPPLTQGAGRPAGTGRAAALVRLADCFLSSRSACREATEPDQGTCP